MLQQSSSKKGSRIAWDEDNLKTNAEIQKEFSGIKVDEPKTPYHRPVAADDDLHGFDEDMNPLELDDGGLLRERSVVTAADAEAAKATVMTAFEYVMSNGGVGYSTSGASGGGGIASSSGAGQAGDGLKVEVPSTSGASYDSGEASSDKKRRFAEMRKQHYNMKDALQQARQLLSNDDEEVDGDDEQDSAAKGGSHRAADGDSRAAGMSSDPVEHPTANGDAAVDDAAVDDTMWRHESSSRQHQPAGQRQQQHLQGHLAGGVDDMDGS